MRPMTDVERRALEAESELTRRDELIAELVAALEPFVGPIHKIADLAERQQAARAAIAKATAL